MTNNLFETQVQIRVLLKPKRPPETPEENLVWSLIEQNINYDAESLGLSLEEYFSFKAYLKYREIMAKKKGGESQ